MKAIIRKDEQAVSPVIATILMVAITVVLAAVLYVMVSGLLVGPGGGPRSMGISISRSADGTNWTLVIASSPTGLTTSGTSLTILNAGGAIALASEAFSSLAYASDRAVYIGDADTTVEASERLLVSTSTYPTGFRAEISDGAGLLFSGTLQ
ncbi:MAG TPA: archaellin/type IV pilin N-terminal domain-containing protein [Thermoplasmata archaeon]|nr:archaellin/type IV pilin N-terminal domain-containing protein [Thermoplasmata archaeon]